MIDFNGLFVWDKMRLFFRFMLFVLVEIVFFIEIWLRVCDIFWIGCGLISLFVVEEIVKGWVLICCVWWLFFFCDFISWDFILWLVFWSCRGGGWFRMDLVSDWVRLDGMRLIGSNGFRGIVVDYLVNGFSGMNYC